MTRVKKNVEILNYSTNTVANLNWRAKRDVSGYYGCGDCGLCKLSIFGDKFKVHHTNYWYKISGGLTATIDYGSIFIEVEPSFNMGNMGRGFASTDP